MQEKLALFGGEPVLKEPLPLRTTYGKEEIAATQKVLEGGILSDFVGRAGEKFLGGRSVQELESLYTEKFKVKYAVSFNSASTALQAAVGALGVGPGDEVIVPPMTMTSTIASVLWNNAIPIFADIEDETFGLDPQSVEGNITDKTKAVLIVNLFGQAANLPELKKVAVKHKIKIIEDNAQSPGAKIGDDYVGTIGDVGVFSLNFHKVIHCGEGGVLVTNDKEIAYRAQLIRNHGEIVLDDLKDNETVILGNNFRLTELQAAVAIEQLKKLDYLNLWRAELADYLTSQLKNFSGLEPVKIRNGFTHVYYQYPIKFQKEIIGIKRSTFVEALKKEGFTLGEGCVKPLYLLPLYQNLMVYKKGVRCPFDCPYYDKKITYQPGLCPVDERLYEEELLLTGICTWPLTKEHIDLFIKAITKVLNNIEELKIYEARKVSA